MIKCDSLTTEGCVGCVSGSSSCHFSDCTLREEHTEDDLDSLHVSVAYCISKIVYFKKA